MTEYKGKIKKEFLDNALAHLTQYKADKKILEDNIARNIKLYKADYAKMINPETNEPEPASSFVFSAIENKYADAVDNYPAPNFLEREEADAKTAEILSKVVAAELDLTNFKTVYKDNARRKPKFGTAIYGVFYDDNAKTIDIRAIDIMQIYCDMNVRDVQDSRFLFIVNCLDNDTLRKTYPKFKELFDGDEVITSYGESKTLKDRTEVIDCYYKSEGKVHLMKIVRDTIIDATEDIEGYEDGLYKHGLYPIVFDVMYPTEDCPFGLSVIDIISSEQAYIDRLDAAILKNVLIGARQRIILKENAGIKEEDLLDISKSVIKASGDITSDAVRELTFTSVSDRVLNYRDTKKNDLKEIVGNRDFQQGGTSGGVTAASAITVLQNAGEKLSRAMCDDSYDAYKKVVIQVVELMREFYDTERIYRVTNESGNVGYETFSNDMLVHMEYDALGFPKSDYKRAEFDIKVVPQRENPFSKEKNNQTLMTLWNNGVFIPDNVKSGASAILIQMMNLDGKDKLLQNINNWKEELMTLSAPQSVPQGNEELVGIDTATGAVMQNDGIDGESGEFVAIDTNSGEVLG